MKNLKKVTRMKQLLILSCVLLLSVTSCKKEDATPSQTINYTAYSRVGDFTFEYIDIDQVWRKVNITQNNYTFSAEQTPDNFNYVTSISTIGPDSLYLSAESNGKLIEKSFNTASTGTMTVRFDLNDLK